MAKTTADSLAAAMRAHGVSEGAIAKIHGELETWANAFRDPVENVKDAVAKIAGNPYIPKNIKVHGLMIHPRTGKLNVIQTAADKPVSGEAAGQEPSSKQQWLDWTVKIQSLAQAGLHYGRDRFDLERYQELRDIAAAMMAAQADLPLAKVKDLFCNETGYQTPKIDTRAAISRRTRSCSFMKARGNGLCPAAGVMSISRSRIIPSKKSRKRLASMSPLPVSSPSTTGAGITDATIPTESSKSFPSARS